MREFRFSPGVVQVLRPRPLEGLEKTDLTTSFPAAERVNRPTPFEGFYEATWAARSGESGGTGVRGPQNHEEDT